MTPPVRSALILDRRAFALAAWAALLATGALGIVSPSAARADDDDDDDGRGRGRGRGGDSSDDDDGGDGGGSDDSDGDDASGDDRNERGGGDGLDGGEGGRDDGQAYGGGPDRSGGTPRDIAVLYPDGWVERIVGGHYELIDDQSRLVVRRAATSGDFSRMDALR